MTAEKIRNRLLECATLLAFVCNGKEGNVDPYYSPGGGNSYLLFFDGNEQTVFSIDDAMTTPFVNGKSLLEIADKIEIIEW